MSVVDEAVRRVLAYFSVQPEDLLYEPAPVTDPMSLWIEIGRTLQHYHCWLYMEGRPSYFTRRTTKEAHIGS